jgi:hypothetical protein
LESTATDLYTKSATNSTNITNNYNTLESTATDLYTKSATNSTNITNNYNTLESTATDLYTKSYANTASNTSIASSTGDILALLTSFPASWNVDFSTPVLNDVFMDVMPSTLTITSVCLYMNVAPTGSNLTIGVSSVTSMTASLGTLTVTAGQLQSNTLSPNIVIPRGQKITYTVTGIGNTIAGYTGSIKNRFTKDIRNGN